MRHPEKVTWFLTALLTTSNALPQRVGPISPVVPVMGVAQTGEVAPKETKLFEILMKPFISEALQKREDRARKEADYDQVISTELNRHRINFLLFSYGETHEPPVTEKATIGSSTIISYSRLANDADIVSFTHDIRAPEVEKLLRERKIQDVPATRIDQAYKVGGLNLLRKVHEDATGLDIDFQIVFKDNAIRGLVDDVIGGLEVEIASSFDVQPFYLDGVKYPAGHFEKGRQTLSGLQIIQLIKTVPVSQGYYGKDLEHNARKHLVFTALLEAVKKNAGEKIFWLKAGSFLAPRLVSADIVVDFDGFSMLTNVGVLGELAGNLSKRDKLTDFGFPTIRSTKYVADQNCCGDGGVQWVSGDMEQPIGGDPFGSDVKYWEKLREKVREWLDH